VNETPSLVVATRNRHKVAEIAAVVGCLFEVSGLEGIPDAPAVEETGATFIENALLKALAVSGFTRALVLADDSGLEVDALGGKPGVHSARFAGPSAEDGANNRKLLATLAGIPPGDRTARFRCALVLARVGRIEAEFEGTVEGRIIEQPKGERGFGYDPLFVPDGEDRTFAELGPETKNALSHRARALRSFIDWARSRLPIEP